MSTDSIMKGWFSEICPMWPGRALSIKIKETLYSKRSPFQMIEVFETEECGKMLVLDGIIQCTESDEFAYQEMMTHVALFSHPGPERVLVIGGGDGGVLREVEKHSTVKEIDICEIDGMVIDAARKFLPEMACGFHDSRVNLHIGDGNEFVKDRREYYDAIIVDSSDPIGPAEALFREPFYVSMKSALRKNGIIATQAESIFLHKETVKSLVSIVRKLFSSYGYAMITVPTYPAGNIGVCLGSLGPEIKKPARIPDRDFQNALKYYTPEIHEAAFVLPCFGKQLLEGT